LGVYEPESAWGRSVGCVGLSGVGQVMQSRWACVQAMSSAAVWVFVLVPICRDSVQAWALVWLCVWRPLAPQLSNSFLFGSKKW
jgi:hypothetical protein